MAVSLSFSSALESACPLNLTRHLNVRFVEKTPSMDNFPGLTATGLPPTMFNIHVYEVA